MVAQTSPCLQPTRNRIRPANTQGPPSQTIELDRIDGLEDSKKYPLKLCFAERHTTESNVRIDTTISLQAVDPPPVTGLFD